jgi:hypothetical protein
VTQKLKKLVLNEPNSLYRFLGAKLHKYHGVVARHLPTIKQTDLRADTPLTLAQTCDTD